ncbi:MAG: T9SS type A sorting domain-containing protein [Reichenbachiella sp.]
MKLEQEKAMKIFELKYYILFLIATFISQNILGQNSCETATNINSTGLYDVDYTDGDQWYAFTASKNGDAVITTGISSHAGTTTKLHKASGEVGFYWKDTMIEIWPSCEDVAWLSNDDYYGLFDGASEINPGSGFTLLADQTYLIKLVDSPNGFENARGGQSPFEIFYWDDLVIGTEEIPLDVTLGLNEDYAHLYYAEEQWFTYQLPNDGIFSITFSTYYDGSNTQINSENEIVLTQWNDDYDEPNNGFTFNGLKDDVVKFSLNGANRNNTFSAVFEDEISCSEAVDLTNNIVVNGGFTYSVDNTEGSQFFEVTVPQDGWLEMTTCIIGYQHDTYLRVYQDNCDNIKEETETGCVSQAALDFEVHAGETFIFEWDPVQLQDPHYLGLDPYQYQAQMIFHELVDGESCANVQIMTEGLNVVDYWFGDQFFTYTAESDGALEVSTCGVDDAYFLNGFDIRNNCAGSPIGILDDTCPLYEDDWQQSIAYEISQGEQVIVQMYNRYHLREDYNFNVIFTPSGMSCELPIEISEPNIYDVAHVHQEDNDQWYKFAAPKSGSAIITTLIPSLASNNYMSAGDTNMEIYDACGGNLIASNDDYVGYFGGSRIDMELTAGTEYYILMIDEWITNSYRFEIFYEEDLIIGTEESPLDAVLGDNGTFGNLHYVNSQWFTYEFTHSGEFNIELNSYVEHIDYWTFLSANQPIIIHEEEDTGVPLGFTFNATAGDVIKFNLNSLANNTFTASFEEAGIIWSAGAWSNVTGPAEGDHVIIDDLYNTGFSGEFLVKNLEITANGELTVSPLTTLDVKGNLINNGFVFVESGSSFLTYEANTFTGNEVIFHRLMRHATSAYSMIGSPVKYDATITGATIAPIIWGYDESIDYDQGVNDGLNRWINWSGQAFIPGRGYAIANVPQFEFSGIPNVGDVVVDDLSFTVDPTSSAESHGWHMISNPYGAAINVSDFLENNPAINGQIALWDDPNTGSRGTSSDYMIMNSLGQVGSDPRGNHFNGHVLSGQGFMVQVLDDAVDPKVTFKEAMRVGGMNNDDNFFRKTKSEVPTIKLAMSAHGFYSETLIGFPTSATIGVDRMFDATKLRSQTAFNLYSWLGDKPLAIQGLPLENDQMIPLGIDMESEQMVTFSIPAITGLDNYSLFFVDTNDDTEIAIKSNDPVNIQLSPGQDQNRYALRITDNTLVSSNEQAIFDVQIYTGQDMLKLFSTSNEDRIQLKIIDLSGKLVYDGESNLHNGIALFTKPHHTGVLIAHVKSGNQIKAVKFINR